MKTKQEKAGIKRKHIEFFLVLSLTIWFGESCVISNCVGYSVG